MRTCYSGSGNWYKGNTHVHTTASDGGMSSAGIAALYAGAGYSFLFRTDHWVTSDVASDGQDAPLLWLDGIELDGRDKAGHYYHVACLGRTEGITHRIGFVRAIEAAREQGALLVLAHPFWTGNSSRNTERFAFHGIEIYNHVCQWLNGKGDSRVYWNWMLGRNAHTLAFAVDDAHLRPEHPGWNGGWIAANAPELSASAIMDAIRRGDYYSSCGPEFHHIEVDGEWVNITTSPVQFVRLSGPGFLGQRLGGFGEERLSEASFRVPSDWAYAYIEIEDECGRRAWTNTLFTPA